MKNKIVIALLSMLMLSTYGYSQDLSYKSIKQFNCDTTAYLNENFNTQRANQFTGKTIGYLLDKIDSPIVYIRAVYDLDYEKDLTRFELVMTYQKDKLDGSSMQQVIRIEINEKITKLSHPEIALKLGDNNYDKFIKYDSEKRKLIENLTIKKVSSRPVSTSMR